MSLELAPASGAASSNLAAALLLLPQDRRRDALIFYRFCRAVDDISDSNTLAPGEKESLLNAWHRAVASGSGLPAPLAEMIAARHLDPALLLAIIEGCASDVQPRPFPNIEALDDYCWKVAGAVGLVSIRIFGCKDPASSEYATRLGRALQLTNILRDAAEDAARGRVYFPEDILHLCGCSRKSLLKGSPDRGFHKAAELLASEARKDFERATPAPGDCRALLPAILMSAIYRDLLETIARDDYRVFERKYAVPAWKKIALALRVVLAPGAHRRR